LAITHSRKLTSPARQHALLPLLLLHAVPAVLPVQLLLLRVFP
jgi:hypothetical protein